MANTSQILQALATIPPARSAPPITPPFVGGNGPTVLPPPSPALPPPRPPAPPMGGMSPPESLAFPMPEAPPAAPAAPIDRSYIDQALATLPPEPAAPVTRPASFLDRLSEGLLGVSAGLQGRGGEFLQQRQEQRERPQREYEARKERYDARKADVVLTATDRARQAEERRQERENRTAQRNFELEVESRARQLGFKHDEDMANLRSTLEAKARREENDFALKRQDLALKAEDARLDKEINAANKRQDKQLAASLYEKKLEIVAARARVASGQQYVVQLVGQNGENYGQVPYDKLSFTEFGDVKGYPEKTRTMPPGFQPPPGGGFNIPPMIAAPTESPTPTPTPTPGPTPKLNNQQRARFDDIKKARPDLSDDQVYQYMRAKKWIN